MDKFQPEFFEVNLEEVISNYAWESFLRSKNVIRRRLMRNSIKNYEFQIRWQSLDFTHETIAEKKEDTTKTNDDTHDKADEDKPTDGATGDDKHVEKSLVRTEVDQLRQASQEANKRSVELYFTEYENETLSTQTYKFTTTRQTTETTRIEMRENYTLGAETNLSINLGKIASFGGKINTTLSVTDTKVQEYSKSLTWNIDTDIKVPRWHRLKATLYVYETPITSSFEVNTTVRLRSPLPVYVHRVKDGKRVYIVVIFSLRFLFGDDYLRRSGIRIEEEIVERNGKQSIVENVILTTRGVCRYVGFKNQHVRVECKEMDGAPLNLPPLYAENH
ncbi:hypothetical protein ACF0H5_017895 [Mactra antiquata]